ncbi:MAG: hypothetical protein U0Q16_19955 [Bryobacteraceae bacterium]
MDETTKAAELIQRAFALARQSGKSDWWAMRSPVLKNRLLMLTANKFKEADFGAASFRDFVNKAGDIVRIDETAQPPFIILKAEEPSGAEGKVRHSVRGNQVRSDLWRAILDYSSGLKYVWDASEQCARPARPEDTGPMIPTISQAELDQWRAEFLSLHPERGGADASRAEEWRQNRLPTAALPQMLRPVWNSHLKRKVAGRLQEWFTTNSIAPPAITAPPPQESASLSDQVESLREFVLDCVKAMSKEELLDLRISPLTAFRASNARKSMGKHEY